MACLLGNMPKFKMCIVKELFLLKVVFTKPELHFTSL